MSVVLRVVAAACLLMLTVSVPSLRVAPDTVRTINPNGGTNMDDGVRFVYGYNSFQIIRSEVGGFYGGKKGEVLTPSASEANMNTTIMVAIGDETFTVDTEYWSGFSLATSTSTTQACDRQLSSVFTMNKNSLIYELVVTAVYTPPEKFVRLRLGMDIPPANTDEIIVYIIGRGQSLYNDTNEVQDMLGFGTAGMVVFINENSYNEVDSHFMTGMLNTGGAPWTGTFVGNPNCGLYADGCELTDGNPFNHGPRDQLNVPNAFNYYPLDAANRQAIVSINFNTSGVATSELSHFSGA
jgi:hypothetical protein